MSAHFTYDAYLFDWDGTLSHTLDIWLTATHDVLTEYGAHISRQEVGPLLGAWEKALQEIPREFHKEAKTKIEAIAHPQMLRAPLHEGVEEMLKDLKNQNKKLALITAAAREVIEIVLAHHDLLDLFDLVITANEVKASKPDPEGILFVLDSFGIDPAKAVMLGDSDKDLGAAQNAGVDSILFYPDSHKLIHKKTFLESFKPVRTLNNWSEL